MFETQNKLFLYMYKPKKDTARSLYPPFTKIIPAQLPDILPDDWIS